MEIVLQSILGLIALSASIVTLYELFLYELLSFAKLRLHGKRTLQVIGLDEDLKFRPVSNERSKPPRQSIVYQHESSSETLKILVIEDRDGPVIPLTVEATVYRDVSDILNANRKAEVHLDVYVDAKRLTIKKVLDYRVRSNPDPLRYRTHYLGQAQDACPSDEPPPLSLTGLRPRRFDYKIRE